MIFFVVELQGKFKFINSNNRLFVGILQSNVVLLQIHTLCDSENKLIAN